MNCLQYSMQSYKQYWKECHKNWTNIIKYKCKRISVDSLKNQCTLYDICFKTEKQWKNDVCGPQWQKTDAAAKVWNLVITDK